MGWFLIFFLFVWGFFFPFLFPFPFLFFFFPFSARSGQPHSKGRSVAPGTGGWGRGMGTGIPGSLFFPVAVGSQGRVKPCQVEGVEPGSPHVPPAAVGAHGGGTEATSSFWLPWPLRRGPRAGQNRGEEREEMGQTARTSPPDPPLCSGVRVRLVQVFLSSAKRQFLICKVFN